MHLTASAIPLRKIAHTTQSLTQLIRIAGVRQSHESLPFLAECLAGHHGGTGSGGERYGGGPVPCFWLWQKSSVLCKNKPLKLSILCILCLECYIFQYICRR